MPMKITGKRSQLMHWLSWFEASHIPAEIMGMEHIRAMKLRIAIKLLLTAMAELSSFGLWFSVKGGSVDEKVMVEVLTCFGEFYSFYALFFLCICPTTCFVYDF